jgi:hypothetical protein
MGQKRLYNEIFPHRSEILTLAITQIFNLPAGTAESVLTLSLKFSETLYHTTQTHPSRQNARQTFPHQLRRLSHHPFTGLYRFCGPTPSPLPQIRTPLPLLVNATAEQFDASVTLLSPPVGCVTHLTYQNDTSGARSGLNAWCNAGNVVRGTSAEFLSPTSATTQGQPTIVAAPSLT